VTYQFLEDVKESNPDLVIRKFSMNSEKLDKKDSGLRVPWVVVDSDGKKKKKKKSKK
jgi:hypothetical protein